MKPFENLSGRKVYVNPDEVAGLKENDSGIHLTDIYLKGSGFFDTVYGSAETIFSELKKDEEKEIGILDKYNRSRSFRDQLYFMKEKLKTNIAISLSQFLVERQLTVDELAAATGYAKFVVKQILEAKSDFDIETLVDVADRLIKYMGNGNKTQE